MIVGRALSRDAGAAPPPPEDAPSPAGYPLDRDVDKLRHEPRRPWLLAGWGSILAIPFLVVVAGLLHLNHLLPSAADDLVVEVLLTLLVLAVGRPVVRLSGGWQPAVGLGRPRQSDWMPAAVCFLAQVGARVVVGLALSAILPSVRSGHDEVNNISGVDQLAAGQLLLFALTVVVLAPVVEELIFRGLVLRSLLRRFPFWPSAVVSSLLFGLFHAPEGDDAIGALILAVVTATFGVLQCIVVRRTGRLAPAMIVHAGLNGLSLVATLV